MFVKPNPLLLLLELPNAFTDLYWMSGKSHCVLCGQQPAEPAKCLICGGIFCLRRCDRTKPRYGKRSVSVDV